MYTFRDIVNYGKKKILGRSRIGDMTFMCPHCYNVELFNGCSKTLLKPYRKYEVKQPFIDIAIKYPCPECGRYAEQISVDPNIAVILSVLNKKGWKTLFSCEGHSYTEYNNGYKSECCNHPYILFDPVIYKEAAVQLRNYPLPKTWGITVDGIKVSIRSENEYAGRFDDLLEGMRITI